MIVGDEGYPLYKEKDGKEKLTPLELTHKGAPPRPPTPPHTHYVL